MSINPRILTELEAYGLTSDHLQQLLAVCERGAGRITWHADGSGRLVKVEATLTMPSRNRQGMRELTHLLQKDSH